MFLQVTHLLDEDNRKIERRWQGSVFTASLSSRARGVMTPIHKSITFQVKNVIKDRLGRYLIIQGTLLTENLNLVSVYGPNIDNANFYVDLFPTLSASGGYYIIEEEILIVH